MTIRLTLLVFGLMLHGHGTVGSFVSQPTPFIRHSKVKTHSQMRLLSTVAPVPPVQKEKKLTNEAQELEETIRNKKESGKLLVAQTAPSVRVAFPEEFRQPPGAFSTGILIAALKELGFDLVVDTNIAADLCICEEGTELLHRVMLREEKKKAAAEPEPELFGDNAVEEEEPLPLFTSCCPGWMNFIQKSEPSLIPYISTCLSPHMMLGAVMKRYSKDLLGRAPEDVYLTSVMPCLRKRSESDRPAFCHDGVRNVDNVITTKDLGELLRRHEIDPSTLTPRPFDSPCRPEGRDEDCEECIGTGAGQLFGATGGVMEAAVRSVYELLTGAQLPRIELDEVRGLDSVKEAVVPLYNKETGKGLKTELRVAVANGLGNAKKLIKKMKEGEVTYDFVEVMACPGGCCGGGGQPKGDKDVVKKRIEATYSLDRSLPIRRSHENPTVKFFYDHHLGEIGGDEAHNLLHVKQVYGEGGAEKE